MMVVGFITVVLMMLVTVPNGSMAAAVPLPVDINTDTFVVPNDGLIIFSNRDFVTVEGYKDFTGALCTVTVYRPSKTSSGYDIIGQAKVEISGADVAFEVNHPGGACWAQGVDTEAHPELKVTPDIKVGDRLRLEIEALGDKLIADQVVRSPQVRAVGEPILKAGGAQEITIEGIFGDDMVNLAASAGVAVDTLMEQRTVNPDFVDMIGKRSLRATSVPTDPVAARDDAVSAGRLIYVTSQLTTTISSPNNVILATYTFTPVDGSTEAAQAASDAVKAAQLGGGHRLMSWDSTTPAGDRVKMTISEFGEPGGPGMGGCPAGSSEAAPIGTIARLSTTADTATVRWAPTVTNAASAPVTEYMVIWQWSTDTTLKFEGQFIGLCTDSRLTPEDPTPLCEAVYTLGDSKRTKLPDSAILRPISTIDAVPSPLEVVGAAYTVSDALPALNSGSSGTGSSDATPDIVLEQLCADGATELAPCTESGTKSVTFKDTPSAPSAINQVFYTLDNSNPVESIGSAADVSLTAKVWKAGTSITISKPVTIWAVAIDTATGRYKDVQGDFKPPKRAKLPTQVVTRIAESSGGLTLQWADIAGTAGAGAPAQFYFAVQRYTLLKDAEPVGDWLVTATDVWQETGSPLLFTTRTATISIVSDKKVYYAVFPKYVDAGIDFASASLIVGKVPGRLQDVMAITRVEVKKANLRVRGTINKYRGTTATMQVMQWVDEHTSQAIGSAFTPATPDGGVTGDFDVTVGPAPASGSLVYVTGVTSYYGNSTRTGFPFSAAGRRLLQG